MIPVPEEDDWDFGPVFDLNHSLSISSADTTHQKKNHGDTSSNPPERTTNPAAASVQDQSQTQLGNFDKIWQYLGQPLHLPPPTVTTRSSTDCIDICDGQTASEPRILKAVRWQDDVDCANLADNDENNGIADLSKLTKQQRKKARRKQSQAEHADLAAQSTNTAALQSGSEDELVKDVQSTNTVALQSGSKDELVKDAQEEKTLDRSTVIYQILHGTAPPVGTGHLQSGKVFRKLDAEDARNSTASSPLPVKQVLQILKPVRESALEIAAAKKKNLMSMLNEKFVDDREYLSNLSFVQTVAGNTYAAAEGVHVFVDASNVRWNISGRPCLAANKHPNR